MPYRTVMRFSEPERLVIAVAEPGRGTVRHDIRLGGIGADGTHRYIETDEGPGRPPRRFRIDHIAGATRSDGRAVDIREAIIDAHDWERLSAGEVVDIAPRNRVRETVTGIAIALALGAVATGVGLVTGDAGLALQVFAIACIAVGLGALAFALPGLVKGMADIFRPRR